MKTKAVLYFRWFLFFLAIINIVLYLLSCLTPYISPATFSVYTFLSLGFPLLLVSMLFWVIVSAIFYRKPLLFLLIIILLGYKNISTTIGFHYHKKFVQSRAKGTIRLLSWNVNALPHSEEMSDTLNYQRRETLLFIQKTNADVLCFQDFENYNGPKYLPNVAVICRLGYPYYYFPIDYRDTSPTLERQYGSAIFSRYPIINTGRVFYKQKHFPESLIYADIKINNDTVRFYSTHLRSMLLSVYTKDRDEDYRLPQDDTAVIFHTGIMGKLKYFDTFHVTQALIVKKTLDTTSKPLVFCADLNSVPSSFVYHHVSKGLQDAFLQNGFGWGATYENISPTLRIDVVLMNKYIQSTQYYSPKVFYSDHFPIITDLSIKN